VHAAAGHRSDPFRRHTSTGARSPTGC
jgi:hypothetical protein